MSEIGLLEALVRLAVGAAAFGYADEFLRRREAWRRKALLLWEAAYLLGQSLLAAATDRLYPYNSFVNVITHFLLLFALQEIFFERDRPKQLFVTASVAAGWEILRFTASPLGYVLHSLCGSLLVCLVGQEGFLALMDFEGLQAILERLSRISLFGVLLVCRSIQIALLVFYLRGICRRFPRRREELGLQESLFLVFPCVTVLCLDLTIRLMAVSVNNGAMDIIFSRVPETVALLPLVSLLLLGTVVSAVASLQNLMRRKEEEARRLLLENRVIDVQREMEELSDIYAGIRGLRHDLRNHIASLAAYVRSAGRDGDGEVGAYLGRMTETVNRLDFSCRTGNAITDIILHHAGQRARKRGIRFEADFRCPEAARFDVYDISVILNNALQNALEACEKAGGKRAVEVRSYRKGSLFFLEVENDFSGPLEWDAATGLPRTTKPGRRLHGIGLSNVERCAKKYRGGLDVQVLAEGGRQRFRLTVMLYGREGEEGGP